MAAENKAPDRVANLEAENAQLRDRLNNLEKLVSLQSPVMTPLRIEQDREIEFKKKQEELSLSCKERTQFIARMKWQEKTEYPVKVADVPEIMIPARSPEEAKGRYDHLCGINGVDPKHKYEIGQPVPAAA